MNSNNQWTGTKISFESIDFNEMIVDISFNNGSDKWFAHSFYLTSKSEILSTDITMVGGYCYKTTDCCSIAFTYNNTGISAVACTYCGNQGYNGYIAVYYR